MNSLSSRQHRKNNSLPRLTSGGSILTCVGLALFDIRGLVLQRFDLNFVVSKMKRRHWKIPPPPRIIPSPKSGFEKITARGSGNSACKEVNLWTTTHRETVVWSSHSFRFPSAISSWHLSSFLCFSIGLWNNLPASAISQSHSVWRKRSGPEKDHFSISNSSFVLFFVLLPFFLKWKERLTHSASLALRQLHTVRCHTVSVSAAHRSSWAEIRTQASAVGVRLHAILNAVTATIEDVLVSDSDRSKERQCFEKRLGEGADNPDGDVGPDDGTRVGGEVPVRNVARDEVVWPCCGRCGVDMEKSAGLCATCELTGVQRSRVETATWNKYTSIVQHLM